jgi:sphingosine kinase
MGLAPRKWETARDILDVAHLEVTLKPTERQGHAYDILKDELQIGQYDGILTISGDGLIHESVNGAMSRPDRDQFLENLSFGFIPAGTGNGLHKSVVDTYDEKDGIYTAAFAVAKGRTTKMDLTELDLEYFNNEKKVYMFLILAWAVIADCDLNSEVIRCCGPPRFTVWGVYRCWFVRHYPAEFEYTGYVCKNNHEEDEEKVCELKTSDETYKIVSVFNTPYSGQELNTAPLSKIDDGMNDITIMTGDKSRI